MAKAADWAFTKRFRRGGFGWHASRLASERISEALAEIQAVARHDPLYAADGAVRFLVKLSPALEQVDSSSGALGGAARAAVESERHAVVSIHPNGRPVAMQWMKPHSGHRHLRRLGGGIEGGKGQIQAFRVLRLYLASIPSLEWRRESLMPETPDHRGRCGERMDS